MRLRSLSSERNRSYYDDDLRCGALDFQTFVRGSRTSPKVVQLEIDTKSVERKWSGGGEYPTPQPTIGLGSIAWQGIIRNLKLDLVLFYPEKSDC